MSMLRQTSRHPSFLTALLIAVALFSISTFNFSIPTHATAVISTANNVVANEADFKPDVIYQVVLDRFFDGNSANNDPAGGTGLYDSSKSNWKLYWGGDLA